MAINMDQTCFLCLQNFLFSEHVSGDNLTRKYNLRQILRLLNIQYNISVSFCKKCASTVEQLIKFCTELELIEMKVNWKLKEFTEVLEKSRQKKESTVQVQSTMLAGVETNQEPIGNRRNP